jgi:hypothetical protein
VAAPTRITELDTPRGAPLDGTGFPAGLPSTPPPSTRTRPEEDDRARHHLAVRPVAFEAAAGAGGDRAVRPVAAGTGGGGQRWGVGLARR